MADRNLRSQKGKAVPTKCGDKFTTGYTGFHRVKSKQEILILVIDFETFIPG
jgi:hypothetical protein